MGVTFNEENNISRTQRAGSNSGFVTKLILKTGIANSEGQARIVMIVISVAAIAATIFVLMS